MEIGNIAPKSWCLLALCIVHAAQAATTEPPAKPTDEASVCREGCAFTDLNKAIQNASAGSVITVAPGRYGWCGVVKKPIRLVGLKDAEGNRAHLAGGVCWGKATLVLRASDIVIEGFEISDVSVPSKNGACIRVDPQAGDITIKDLHCHDSENGLLGGPQNGRLTIEDSRFERNGANNGFAHGIYVNNGEELVVKRSQFTSTKGEGHGIKSGAKRTVIEDTIVAALEGRNSRAIDIYGGGVFELRRSVIQQSESSANHEAIGLALERKRINPQPHSTLIEDNWFIFDDLERCCRWLLTAKQLGPVTIRKNKFVGMTRLTKSRLKPHTEKNVTIRNRGRAGLADYDGTLASLPQPGS